MITYEDFRDKRREYAFTKSVSNNPKDQDAARKIRTQMDYDDLKKQIGSKKKPQLPANAVVEGDVHSGQGEKIQKRTKAWMDKKGMKGAPGLDAMKSRTKEHEASRGVKKDLKNEYSPAVDKVIESIKINKASPKSPNCIIMPKKDDITDKAGGKKSTKDVVTKKQKQFFNQEGKSYSSFLKEYLSTLTKAAASQAAKGAITTTAKTVGKETVKQTGGAIVKSTGGQVAKQTGGAIIKSGGGKLATKGGAIVKSGGKEIVKHTATQTAIDKINKKKPPTTGEKKPPTTGEKEEKREPPKKIDYGHAHHVGKSMNPQ